VRDVFALTAIIAFFALGAVYIVVCARILSRTGDIDEPLTDGAAADDSAGVAP
jgi:hypothetical protein